MKLRHRFSFWGVVKPGISPEKKEVVKQNCCPKYHPKREKTALDRGWTDCISLTHDLDLDLQAMVMTYSHAKVQDQRSVDSEECENKRTDRRTEATALSPSLMRSVASVSVYLYVCMSACVHLSACISLKISK